MQISVLIILKILFACAFIFYLIGAFKVFLDLGYSIINGIIQTCLHLFLCAYFLFGWVNLLANTPGLGLISLSTVGVLWLMSCYALYSIIDFLQSLIPLERSDESFM